MWNSIIEGEENGIFIFVSFFGAIAAFIYFTSPYYRRRRANKKEAPPRPLKVKVIDYRTKKEKKIKEEGARGIGIDPEADKLMQLMVKAHESGRSQGFPVYKEYPQYKRVRSIGNRINDEGGLDALQRNWAYIRAKDRTLGSMLEGFWDGIGEWRA